MKKRILLPLIMMGIVASSAVFAESKIDRISKKLELTQEQAEQFKVLHQQAQANRQAAQATKAKIKGLMAEGNIDEAAQLASEQAAAKVREMAARQAELASFLNEQQIAKLETMKQRIKKHHKRKNNKSEQQD
ncbi:hypothetical protein [Paraferrimonas sp. SM1919]|uniref:hypothetical protein n=1 Tax=Paraferrimonas sp. SM1919 TaxID=2662263 RepID=UPI0013D4D939|nr:hypothetical protein [Paraferrimonas sp. SM1919]